MSAAPPERPLARLLGERIRNLGPITFAEYMRACLFHPEFGYYSRADALRFADFYTSVDVHPLFGRLIARQLAEMWELLGRPTPFLVVEVGAGTGQLASHILDFAARHLPVFYAATQYIAVESSPARRTAHARALATHFGRDRAHSRASLPREIPAGCIFSNELLDALPVHRVVRESGQLREIYVGHDAHEFREVTQALSTPALADYFRAQDIVLAEGQQAEAGLDACMWMEDAGKRLGRGLVMTIDYGHEARELYNARHMRGTLLAYQQHRAGEDYYRAPGEQDLTAHVNFTALEQWGHRSGLNRTGLVSQAQFLMALGRGNEFADLYEEGESETDRLRARLKLKTLIFPEGMGERFDVFIQHKGIETPRLTGLESF